MKVTYLPVLGVLRELHQQPRNVQRFRNYIASMTSGTDDVVLPIGVANPMAREHALARLDELLLIGADEIGAQSAKAAEVRLERIETVEIKASIVLADDVGGGWTNRYTTEAMLRFPGRGALKRPFASALVWTSESPTDEQLRQEVLAAIYRVAYQQRHGLVETLAERLEQEGLAAVFSGYQPTLANDDIEGARAIIHALGDDPPYPAVFAALYGDAAAEELGYAPLGLPPRAGFAVALAQTRELGRDPVEALATMRPRLRDNAAADHAHSAASRPHITNAHKGRRTPP